MKKLSMLLTAILLVSTLTVALAVPVLAHGMTVVDIEASATEVSPGDPAVLTITESNTGAVPLINVSLTLWDGTAFLSPVLVGNGNGDDILDAGEVWQWEITVYPVTCTVYEATGYGFYKDPVTGKEYHVTWPDWPSERDSVEVVEAKGSPLVTGRTIWMIGLPQVTTQVTILTPYSALLILDRPV
jgi:uncharacterized repeat protein (TIGR01451 family)